MCLANEMQVWYLLCCLSLQGMLDSNQNRMNFAIDITRLVHLE